MNIEKKRTSWSDPVDLVVGEHIRIVPKDWRTIAEALRLLPNRDWELENKILRIITFKP